MSSISIKKNRPAWLLLPALLLGLLATAFSPAAPAQAADDNNCQTFKETELQVCGRFLEYWQQNGGLERFGFPISSPFEENNAVPPAGDGKRHQVQYFQRARFELHTENAAPYDVLFGLLGTEQFRAKYARLEAPVKQPGQCQYFKETDLEVCGRFLEYWQANGGLTRFGYPVSGAFNEPNDLPPGGDGKIHKVQYFQRARFEEHKENAAPNDVLLGLLGQEQYQTRYSGKNAPGQTPPAVTPQVTVGKLAFSLGGSGSSQPDNPNGEVYISRQDGRERYKVGNGTAPILSPDGTRVAFIKRTLNNESPLDSYADVVIADAKVGGGNEKSYCRGGANASIEPQAWSPDGRYIALAVGQNFPTQIKYCDTLENKLTDAPVKSALLYDFAPEGTNALWQNQPNPSLNIVTLDLFYGDPRQPDKAVKLTSGENTAQSGMTRYYRAARISPDGKTIAILGNKLSFISVPGQTSPLAGKSFELNDPNSPVVTGKLAWSPQTPYIESRFVAYTDSYNDISAVYIRDVYEPRLLNAIPSVNFGGWGPGY